MFKIPILAEDFCTKIVKDIQYQKVFLVFSISQEAKVALLAEGYDCWIEDNTENAEIVVFKSDQIFEAGRQTPQELLKSQEGQNTIYWQIAEEVRLAGS